MQKGSEISQSNFYRNWFYSISTFIAMLLRICTHDTIQ